MKKYKFMFVYEHGDDFAESLDAEGRVQDLGSGMIWLVKKNTLVVGVNIGYTTVHALIHSFAKRKFKKLWYELAYDAALRFIVSGKRKHIYLKDTRPVLQEVIDETESRKHDDDETMERNFEAKRCLERLNILWNDRHRIFSELLPGWKVFDYWKEIPDEAKKCIGIDDRLQKRIEKYQRNPCRRRYRNPVETFRGAVFHAPGGKMKHAFTEYGTHAYLIPPNVNYDGAFRYIAVPGSGGKLYVIYHDNEQILSDVLRDAAERVHSYSKIGMENADALADYEHAHVSLEMFRGARNAARKIIAQDMMKRGYVVAGFAPATNKIMLAALRAIR